MSVDTTTRGADTTSTVRTYGGWRQTREIGLLGLGMAESLVALCAVMVPVLLASVSVRAAVWALPVSLLVLAGLLVKVKGIPVGHYVLARARWAWAKRKGWTSYRGGVLVDHPGAWQLPGVMAPLQLLEVEDGRGGTMGLVWDRRTGLFTATLVVAANSTWLVDGDEADAWVANWHQWLAALGYQPLVRWATVTIDTAPASGTTLADRSRARITDDAPADSVAFLEELLAASPSASAEVATRVSVTIDPSASAERLEDVSDHAAVVARTLIGLESTLGQCGATVLRRASAVELAGTVRTAFDPAARGEVARAQASPDAAELLEWGSAGPVAAEESWDHWQHDSGWSVSWAWHEAPRQHVTSGVLSRLAAPGRFPRRVTLLYEALPAASASAALEQQVNATAFRAALNRRQGRDATARDVADRERALHAAQEEAAGAGVVHFSLWVTTTVDDHRDLPLAVAEAQDRAEQSQIQLRRLYGAQSLGFATTLPLGVCPPRLTAKGHR